MHDTYDEYPKPFECPHCLNLVMATWQCAECGGECCHVCSDTYKGETWHLECIEADALGDSMCRSDMQHYYGDDWRNNDKALVDCNACYAREHCLKS